MYLRDLASANIDGLKGAVALCDPFYASRKMKTLLLDSPSPDCTRLSITVQVVNAHNSWHENFVHSRWYIGMKVKSKGTTPTLRHSDACSLRIALLITQLAAYIQVIATERHQATPVTPTPNDQAVQTAPTEAAKRITSHANCRPRRS